MKRVLIFVLFLFLAVLAVSPVEVAAVDGDVGQTITFSDTLDGFGDDVMHHPDAEQYYDMKDNMTGFTWYQYGNEDAGDTLTVTDSILEMESVYKGSGTDYDHVYTNESHVALVDNVMIKFMYRMNYTSAFVNYKVVLSDVEPVLGGNLVYYDIPASVDEWNSMTILIGTTAYSAGDPDLLNDIDTLYFQVILYNGDSAIEWEIKDLQIGHNMAQTKGDGYAESCAGVDDWTEDSFTGNDNSSTDGDVGNFTSEHDAGSVNDYWYSDSPSITVSGSYYVEITFQITTTLESVNLKMLIYTADAMGGSSQESPERLEQYADAADTWYTYKWLVTLASVECVGFHSRTYAVNRSLLVDSLRVAPADEFGFGHDGSTTEGFDVTGGAVVTSDGSTANVTNDAGSAVSEYLELDCDTTATQASIPTAYYPTLEFEIGAVNDAGSDGLVWLLRAYTSVATYTEMEGYTDGTGVFRYNLAAVETDLKSLRWYVNRPDDSFTLKYASLYGIANYTYSGSSVGIDDYLCVSGTALYSNIDTGSIVLDNDPAQSIASASYQVYNLSTSGTAPEFSMYVSAWSDYSDDTRGATSTGTVTDYRLRFNSTEDISSIKFIEDATAPSVVRSSVNPTIPNDDEGITLKAVITDTLEVWSVNFNAIVYPSGFADVDYSASEVSDNLWMYSFTSLDSGNYTFKVIASDGANTNALTEYAYIDFIVREAAITINPITFLGAGDDFEQVTLSFDCNRDGTYSIVEWTAADASDAAETWTGTVIDGWNNIAWDKLTTTTDATYFNFTITSGSLTWTFENQYQVAKTTFYHERVAHTEDLHKVYVSGRITKTGAYAVYNVNTSVLIKTGTVKGNDFSLYFDKWIIRDERGHNFAIRFSNGSQTCWYNGTYYGTIEELGGGGPIIQPYDAQFWFVMAVLITICSLIGMTVGKKIGDVPNYGGK